MANIVKPGQAMTIDLANTAAQLPAYLAGLPTVVGRIAVGNNRNRIGLKGREFHIFKGGVEEGVLAEKYADVIVVGAVPHVSRLYYQGRYNEGEAKAPACYSVDGVRPAEDVLAPQCGTCMACPQNVAGSGINEDSQGKSRACGFFRRLAVILADDPEHTVFQLDIRSQGLFDKKGDPANNRYGFNEYAKKLAAANNGAGIDIGYVVTRLSFDPAVGTPKLFFQPIDYISQQEVAVVVELIETGVVKNALDMSIQTVDLSAEVPQQSQAPAQRVATPQRNAPVQQVEPVEEEVTDRPTLQQTQSVPIQTRPAVRTATRVVNRPTQATQVVMPPEEERVAAPAPRTTRVAPQTTRTVAPTQTAVTSQDEVDDLLRQLEG